MLHVCYTYPPAQWCLQRWNWWTVAAPGRSELPDQRVEPAERRSSHTHTSLWWITDLTAAERGQRHLEGLLNHLCKANTLGHTGQQQESVSQNSSPHAAVGIHPASCAGSKPVPVFTGWEGGYTLDWLPVYHMANAYHTHHTITFITHYIYYFCTAYGAWATMLPPFARWPPALLNRRGNTVNSMKTIQRQKVQWMLPEDDMDRLEPRCDVGLSDLWSVRLQQMRLSGFNIGDRGCQTLPQTQQVVNTVRGKLPVLRHTHTKTRWTVKYQLFLFEFFWPQLQPCVQILYNTQISYH